MYGEGTRPARTWPCSKVLPSVSAVFQFEIVFSSATTIEPPGFVGPLLHELGFSSQAANPGDDCAVLSPPPPLVPQALIASTAVAAIATKPPRPLDRVRMFPPVSYRATASRRETARAHQTWTTANRLRSSV